MIGLDYSDFGFAVSVVVDMLHFVVHVDDVVNIDFPSYYYYSALVEVAADFSAVALLLYNFPPHSQMNQQWNRIRLLWLLFG